MFQETIDIISYDFYCKDRDNYFQDKIVPSIIYDIFKLNPDKISPNTEERCNHYIKKLEKIIEDSGYNTSINTVLEFFPIKVSENMELLGEYIANTPFCMGLDKVDGNPYELVIRLDRTSTNQDLNIFSSLLKEPFGFENIHLVFDYNPSVQINFLKMKHIYLCEYNKIITPIDNNWLHYLQLGYMELFMWMTLYHAIWHLMTAYITCVAKKSIECKDLVEVFEMSEQNIFNKANEVKAFFLQSPLIFNTILYKNKIFMDYLDNWVNTFVDTFNITTHYSTHILRNILNPEQQWVPGFKQNLELVKNFADSIGLKTLEQFTLTKIWNYNGYQNVNPYVKTVKTTKLIEILYTLGSVYHSYTFEYPKLGFTELLYCEKIPSNFYTVLLATLDWKVEFPVYGNYSNYVKHKYIEEFENFSQQLDFVRQNETEKLKFNPIYKSVIHADIPIFTDYYSINTWNTRV